MNKLPAALLLLGVIVRPASSSDSYHLIRKIPVPGTGSWDYLTVDESARRLYVSHGTQVEVLDVDSGAIVGQIPNTPGVHGIAVVSDLGRGFVSDGQSSTVTIFDLKTLKTIGEVPTGKKPDAIIYDPRKGSVFDNLEDEDLVLRIDARKLTVEQRWKTAPCESPSSMAMDRPNRRLFIGCRSHVMAVMNADTGQVITTLPIGDHVDATAFDPETRLIFNSNGEGTISVVHEDSPDHYRAVGTVKTLPRAKTMALDPKTHNLFSRRPKLDNLRSW